MASHREPCIREFVAMIAAVMALNALALDQMLPALPAMGEAFHVANPNNRQWIITAYFLGMGFGSLIYGPLSDRYGRKPIVIWSILLFLIATAICMMAQSFAVMIAGRAAAGLFAAAGRVITVSIVRDRFSGDRMARISSLIFFCFIIVPIIAPSLGQLTLQFGSWRLIFGSLLMIGIPVLVWLMIRLPETLDPEDIILLSVRAVRSGLREIAGHRLAMGYMLATGIVSGALTGFMVSVQQIFDTFFGRAEIFPLAFAAMASFMGLGSYCNSRLVERLGARWLSHASLSAMIGLAAIHCLVIVTGYETLAGFMTLQVMTTLGFAFAIPNFSALSMMPFGRTAGLASTFQTFLTSVVSALLGAAIGAQFNGTPLPTALGFLILGIVGLATVAWAERWRLFKKADIAAPAQAIPAG